MNSKQFLEQTIRGYNEQSNTWEDEDGRLWAVPEAE